MLNTVVVVLAVLFALVWLWGLVKRISGLFIHLFLGAAILLLLYYWLIGR